MENKTTRLSFFIRIKLKEDYILDTLRGDFMKTKRLVFIIFAFLFVFSVFCINWFILPF